MTHLLHEVKDELDWAAREVLDVEGQFAVLEAKLQAYQDQDPSAERDERIRTIEDKKKALNITELYGILARASRRFSLLTRVFEIGSLHTETEDIVTALTDGLLFTLHDTSEDTDRIIFQAADALQNYFHFNFGDEADAQLRDAWLEVEENLRELGRKI